MESTFGAHFTGDHNRTASFKNNDYQTHVTFKPGGESPSTEKHSTTQDQ
jgi:hypothetical protein